MYIAVVFRSVADEDADLRNIQGQAYRTSLRIPEPDGDEEETTPVVPNPISDTITVSYTYVGRTQEEAARQAEIKRMSLTASYPSRNYRVWLGLLSHEVQRPEPQPMRLVELA